MSTTAGGTRKSHRVANAKRTRTCLLDAFTGVPSLVAECYSSCDLRSMRLTCHGMKDAVSSSAEGYSLRLGYNLLKAIAGRDEFLQPCMLQRLRVDFLHLWMLETDLADVVQEHVAQLSAFIAAVGPAISTVTHLTLLMTLAPCNYDFAYDSEADDSEAEDGKAHHGEADDGEADHGEAIDGEADDSEADHSKADHGEADDDEADDAGADDSEADHGEAEDGESVDDGGPVYSRADIIRAAAAILEPLAAACTKLETLNVVGWIGPDVLRRFGHHCPNLTSLEATLSGLGPTSLKQLPALLPHLTSLTALPVSDPIGEPELHRHHDLVRGHVQRSVVCEALQGFPSILSLNIGLLELTQGIWDSLPAGLQSLSCSLDAKTVIQTWGTHLGLSSFEVTSESVGLTFLLELLRMAPNAVTVHTCSSNTGVVFEGECTRVFAQSLQTIDARLQSETLLCLNSAISDEDGYPASYTPDLRISAGFPEASNMDACDSPMDVLMGKFIGQPLLSFTAIEFVDLEFPSWDDQKMCANLSQLCVVFPNVQVLTMENFDFGERKDWGVLIGCESLDVISFTNVGGMCEHELLRLCKESKSLQRLELVTCEGVSPQWAAEIEAKRGRLCKVEVEITLWDGSEGDDEYRTINDEDRDAEDEEAEADEEDEDGGDSQCEDEEGEEGEEKDN